jgi:iron complex outermembrane receptor protein
LEGLAPGPWRLECQLVGYEPDRRDIGLQPGENHVEVRLRSRPLVMDEMVVQARRAAEAEHSPVFVESLPVARMQLQPSTSLPEILDQAVGVKIRRQGGLGSFSTLSIRGSTAEQVQVYLDGVPLNQALGGGVDLSQLPVSGVESVDVYRGSVPARFGGNSIGGVVHIRTQAPGKTSARLQAMTGSMGTRQLSGTAGGTWRRVEYLGMLDGIESRNDFAFLDDNGTEYNQADDSRVDRRNSDFHALRGLAKVARTWGQTRVRIHDAFDLKYQGIPGIGNFQAESTRFDTRRNVVEAELSGVRGQGGYRLVGYRLWQQEEYRDPKGEVGLGGTQHERNTTRSTGLRSEWDAVVRGRGLLTLFAAAHREVFAPRDLLHVQSRLLKSRRRRLVAGGEAEIGPAGKRLYLSGGSQVEVVADAFSGQDTDFPKIVRPDRRNTDVLAGGRFGARYQVTAHWALQGHRGRYQRAPSFFELFGDRGAVVGSTDLVSEAGDNWDVGLVSRRPSGSGSRLVLAEAVYYRNTTRNMIRFVQYSQRVSKPFNIGRALLQGVETRAQIQLGHGWQLSANYAYQVPTNRSSLSYEAGKDLPNAPRHTVNARAECTRGRAQLAYELTRETHHFLDRANLRPVPARILHSLNTALELWPGLVLSLEIDNLAGNQVADLWGYPLPGRSFFGSLKTDLHALHPNTVHP